MSNIATPNVPGFDYDMQVYGAGGAFLPPVKTGSYTLVLEDTARVVSIGRAASSTLTVPTNSQVPFPIGTSVLVQRYGAGPVIIEGASGVTIDVLSTVGESAFIRQGFTAALRKIAANRWTLLGDLTLT